MATQKPKWIRGQAHCLLCLREWIAVAPIGTPWLECPECHQMTGAIKGQNNGGDS